MLEDKDGAAKWRRRGRAGGRGGGRAETRRILKTFAVLLIFFSKWVKLFYDFQRQFLATGGSLFLPRFPSCPLLPSAACPPLFLLHRRGTWRRHVHLARLISSSGNHRVLSLNMDSSSCSFSFVLAFVYLASTREFEIRDMRKVFVPPDHYLLCGPSRWYLMFA